MVRGLISRFKLYNFYVHSYWRDKTPFLSSFIRLATVKTIGLAWIGGACLSETGASLTRCRPSKGRRCIPDVDIQVHVATYLNDFSCSAQVKIQVEFNFELFWKKNQIFWFPCCSTREDLSADVSITYVGLILTKPGRFFFSAFGNSMYGQNSISSISNFMKKISHFWVSMV